MKNEMGRRREVCTNDGNEGADEPTRCGSAGEIQKR